MTLFGRLTRWWQRMSARALHVEITYFHGDDISVTRREFEVRVPDRARRP